MKSIPEEAFTTQPAEIPLKVKVVCDNQKFHEQVMEKGWMVVEVPLEDLSESSCGAHEVPLLKNLVSYANLHKLQRISIRRISKTRWYVTKLAKKKPKNLKGNTP